MGELSLNTPLRVSAAFGLATTKVLAETSCIASVTVGSPLETLMSTVIPPPKLIAFPPRDVKLGEPENVIDCIPAPPMSFIVDGRIALDGKTRSGEASPAGLPPVQFPASDQAFDVAPVQVWVEPKSSSAGDSRRNPPRTFATLEPRRKPIGSIFMRFPLARTGRNSQPA